MNEVTFLPRRVAARLRPPANAILICIHGSTEPRPTPKPGWRDVLYLQFDDEPSTTEGRTRPFTPEMAKAALDFVHRHVDSDELVVQSRNGRSRSAEMALFFSQVLEVPCFQDQKPVSPAGYPTCSRSVFTLLFRIAFADPGHPLVDRALRPH